MPMNFAAMRRRSQMGRRNSGGLRQAFTPPPTPSIPPPTVGNYGEPRMNTMPVNPGATAAEKMTAPPAHMSSSEIPMMGSPGGANVATPSQKTNATDTGQYGIPTQVPQMDPSRRRAMMLPQ